MLLSVNCLSKYKAHLLYNITADFLYIAGTILTHNNSTHQASNCS
ncbi:hypothetical protein IFVP182_C2120005 [Vibrio parahaemolyticus]